MDIGALLEADLGHWTNLESGAMIIFQEQAQLH
jgi:hypothetical protein